jgi:hypothetical protein
MRGKMGLARILPLLRNSVRVPGLLLASAVAFSVERRVGYLGVYEDEKDLRAIDSTLPGCFCAG